MALITQVTALFHSSEVYITYDDSDLLITSIQIINNGSVPIIASIEKLDPPKRKVSHTWNVGDTTIFDVSTGQVHYTYDPIDGNYRLLNVLISVRGG